jgi:hypothetical protein
LILFHYIAVQNTSCNPFSSKIIKLKGDKLVFKEIFEIKTNHETWPTFELLRGALRAYLSIQNFHSPFRCKTLQIPQKDADLV